MNQKNSYESYECEACKIEDESQEHVLECKKIIEMQKADDNEGEKPAYEKLMNGNVLEKVWISKLFSKKLKVIERLRKEKWKFNKSDGSSKLGTKWPDIIWVCSIVITDLEIYYYYYYYYKKDHSVDSIQN